MLTSFSSMASNTGSRSPGELLMTWRTSEVAVCCSSDSASSRVRCCSASNSRVFSDRDYCLVGESLDECHLFLAEGAHFRAIDDDGADHLAFAHHRHEERGPCAALVDEG